MSLTIGFALALLSTAQPAEPTRSQTAPAVYRKRDLVLGPVPEPTGPSVELFNGRDLNDWTGWLGYADPAVTYSPGSAVPIGPGGVGDMFTVVTEDGQPALRVDGKTWGSLVHADDHADYHLRVEYKWSGRRHAPRLDQPENNGLLYHTHGEPGAVWGTWSRSVEFEIMTGSTGMAVPVGEGLRITTDVAQDPAIIAPGLRFMPGAPEGTAIGGTSDWNIEAHTDAEYPVGQWNTLDLYVVGDRAVHVVNGVPVMVVRALCDAATPVGPCQPLTRGRIQIQSEGAETFFRRMTLTPIDRLPTVSVRP